MGSKCLVKRTILIFIFIFKKKILLLSCPFCPGNLGEGQRKWAGASRVTPDVHPRLGEGRLFYATLLGRVTGLKGQHEGWPQPIGRE